MPDKTRRGIDFEMPLWDRIVQQAKENRRSKTAEVIVLVEEALNAREQRSSDFR